MLELSSDLCADLAAVVGAGHSSTDALQRAAYARDLWPRGLLSLGAGLPELAAEEEGPRLVLWPGDAAQVQGLVRRCRGARVAVVPFGAGSGVCGGALTRSVLLDLKRMRRVEIDEGRAQVTFEPGILGTHLEERVNRRGYTLGHFPSSMRCSTAGGWLATRGAGQCSTKYGKIEDVVRGLELVAGTGERLRLGAEGLLELVVGSEGTLGVITEATCALRRLPAARRMRGWLLPDMAGGAGAIRRLLQAGLRPAVVRLYDELDTLLTQRRKEGAAAQAREERGREREDDEVGVDDWLALLRPDGSGERGAGRRHGPYLS